MMPQTIKHFILFHHLFELFYLKIVSNFEIIHYDLNYQIMP
jgi:hypothetical protein